MRAPARSIESGQLLPFFEVRDGRKVYRQMDDELLAAFEADVQGEVKMGGSIGMMIARIREAEKDRDHFRAYAKHSTACEADHDQNDRDPDAECTCGLDRAGKEPM